LNYRGNRKSFSGRQIGVLLCSFFLLLRTQGHAITFNKDSLLKVAESDKDPGKRVDAWLLLSDRYASFYRDSALLYADKGLKTAQYFHLTGGEVHAYYGYEAIYFNTKDISGARAYLKKGIEFSESHHYIDGKIEGYMHYSTLCELLGKNDSMMYYALNALELSKKSSNIEIQAGVAHEIGNIYSYQGDYAKALYYCTQSLNIWNRIGHKNIAGILSDIGNIYYNKSDYTQALIFYKRAYENARQNNDALAYGYSLNNIGFLYYTLDSIPQAIEYYKQALKYYTLDLNKQGIANTEGNLGNAYLKAGKYKEALEHGKINLQFAGDQNYKKGILESYKLMAQAEAKMHHFENAWEYQKRASDYQDTLNKLTINKKVADYETKFEIEKKDNENKLLLANQEEQRAEIKRKNQLNLFTVVIMVLGFVIALLAININIKRKRELNLLNNLNAKILDQKQKLEEANEIKTQLFSIVSHDFKSPLASLNMFLTLLESGDLDDSEIKMLTHEIMERMNITFSFIDNLLGWAQSQLKGYKPVPVKANLYDIVESSFNLYNQQAEVKKIVFRNNLSPAEKVIADDNMLRLVIRNLISNAIKYSNTGGSVTIDSQKINSEIIISVADTGVGISSEILAKLFTSQRVNTVGTSNEPGTGLGLILCKDFIEKNGGRIWVDSTTGKGSVFSFSIPA
jgi:signal transduction histidine kinase/tetratricopeptide (TPR) repeat protein